MLRPCTLRNSRGCGRRHMAKHKIVRHKIVTSDAEIDRAIEHARQLPSEPRVTEVEYRPGPGLDLLILKLSDGRRHLIPPEKPPKAMAPPPKKRKSGAGKCTVRG